MSVKKILMTILMIFFIININSLGDKKKVFKKDPETSLEEAKKLIHDAKKMLENANQMVEEELKMEEAKNPVAKKIKFNNDHKEKKVIAHYMEWYKNRVDRGPRQLNFWDWNGNGEKHDPKNIREDGFRDISSVCTPIIGPYDSLDDDVIEYHILTAKAAGIDGFVVDWYGANKPVDDAFKKMIKIAKKYDFEAGICYEEKISFPGYKAPRNRNEAVEFAKEDFKYVIDNYFSYDNYLSYQGHKLILIFTGYEETSVGKNSFKGAELIDLMEYVGKDNGVLVRQNLMKTLDDLNAGFLWIDVNNDGYHEWFYKTVDEIKAKRDFLNFGMVCPGFDDTGVWGWGNGPRIVPRKNGEYYKKSWDLTLKYDPDMIQIVTWNDFPEGSVIEPTYEYGFKNLDETEKYLSKYKKHNVDLSNNQLPFKLFQLKKALKKYKGGSKGKIEASLDRIAKSILTKNPKEVEANLREIANRLNYKFVEFFNAENEYMPFSEISFEEKQIVDKLLLSKKNLALNKRVTSSSFLEHAPSGGVDGDRGTRWSSDFNDREWFMVDLGKKYKVSSLIIDWETAFATDYFIEVSNNKVDWQVVFHKTNGTGGIDKVNFNPEVCRYVKIICDKRATSWGNSFWEFGIFEDKQ